MELVDVILFLILDMHLHLCLDSPVGSHSHVIRTSFGLL